LEVLATSVAAQQALPGSADQNFHHDAEVGKIALDVIIPSSMNPQTSIVSIVVRSQVKKRRQITEWKKQSFDCSYIFLDTKLRD
jgi:hypothetical protein